jgi:phosphoribosylformimino-5-aminoimidazole carboxamide ribotide isomerase
VPIEVGGGIRNVEAVATYFNAGAGRVVLSTKILEEPSFLLKPELKPYLNKIAVSIDIKQLQGSDVVTSGTAGWSENGDILLDIPSFIKTLSSAGVIYINFSDISRDGMLSGPDIVKIVHFLKLARKHMTSQLSFTYAGGISSLEDVKVLKNLDAAGPEAFIVGKALYEGRFSLKEAIEALKQ